MNTLHKRPRWILVIGVVAFALFVGACGGDGTDEPTTTTAPPSTTTAAAGDTSTTAAPATTTTAAPATTTTAATTTTESTTTTAAPTTTTAATTTTVDVNTLADGSGCTPGTTQLGDGVWYGYVDTADTTSIEFDLACWFTGDGAVQAAAQDGAESPPPNDYYVRNENPQLRTIQVAAGAEVSWLPSTGDPSTQTTVPYSDWLTGRAERGSDYQPGVWVTIAGGSATFIEEQYVP
jgi:hypothetical protein